MTALVEADPGFAPGTIVAKRYRIEEPIGDGAYRARDVTLGRDVAIEIQRAPDDPKWLAHEALARLAHPNVVAVYETGAIDARRFVAREYVRGGTARDWLGQRRGWREIVALFAQAGDGLAAAHHAGLVHGGFKPESVLVGADGRPRVTDFGAAGAADARDDQRAFCAALAGALRGTPTPVRTVLDRGTAAAPDDRFADMPTLLAALRGAARPRRARWIALAAAGALAAGGVAWLAHAQRQRALEASCTRSAIAAVWDAPARAHVAAAFAATGLPYAATTWRSAATTIDRFVASWGAQEREDCVAFVIDHTEPEAFHDRRATCLERARIELEAVVTRLREVDRNHVAQTNRLVGALPDLAVCERADTVASPDPAMHARLSHYFVELAQVESLAYAGRYTEANGRAAGLVAIARGLGSPRDEAEAEYLAGQIAVERADYADAARLYRHALVTAEAAGNDRLVAAIATDLVGLLGNKQANYAAAQPYVEYARAATERIGLVEPRAKIAQATGRIELVAGHFDEAERQLSRALELVEHAAGETTRIASICTDLSQLASARGRPAQAEAFDRRALATYTAELGAEHPVTLTAASNLGATLGELARYDEAGVIHQRVLELTERTMPADSLDLAYALNNVASMAVPAGEFARARELFQRALAIFEKRLDAAHPVIAAVVENLGGIAVFEGRLDDAVRLHTRVLELRRRQLGSQHPDVAKSLLLLAGIAFEQRRFAAARELCEQAHAAIAASDANNPKIMVDIATCRGTAELEAGHTASAAAILERANQLAATVDDMDPSSIGSLRFALARALPPGARALELARSARDLFVHEGAFAKRELAEVDAWLRAASRSPP